MATTSIWVSEAQLDRVIDVRTQAYMSTTRDREKVAERLAEDTRARVGDYLLVERDGRAVGTATALSMTMWVRGAALPTQGVAWVGTAKTARWRQGDEAGIATTVMREILNKARERGQVASALMPFRVSFYEHFGYGVVEHRILWTIPLSAIHRGDHSSIRPFTEADKPALAAARQIQVQQGQCDFERTEGGWELYHRNAANGHLVVDQPTAGGPIESWLLFTDEMVDGRRYVSVIDIGYVSPAAIRRQLHFLASLRDQYSAVKVHLPADLPLHWLLKERQIPHRQVDHPAATTSLYTRMQVRILDHKRFLESLTYPDGLKLATTLAVHETEGNTTTLRVEIESGKAAVKTTTVDPDLSTTDITWSALATGALPPDQARRHALIDLANPVPLPLLQYLATGPMPFSNEYF
jgi:predicted acetyltransferase